LIILFFVAAAGLLAWSVTKGEEKKTSDLILRSAQSARLEGWNARPSFETAAARLPQDEG